MNKKLIIYTDGGSRGNPGPGALGVAIYDEHEQTLKEFGRYLGECTNNEAEYEAVLAGMQEALKMKAEMLDFYLDSELVVKQLTHIYRVREVRLQKLFLRVKKMETSFKKVSFRHIPREKNTVADAQVNKVLDMQEKTRV